MMQMPVRERMQKVQDYINALQYNHTGTQFFDIKKKRSVQFLMQVWTCGGPHLDCVDDPYSDGATHDPRGTAHQVSRGCHTGSVSDKCMHGHAAFRHQFQILLRWMQCLHRFFPSNFVIFVSNLSRSTSTLCWASTLVVCLAPLD